MRIAYVARWDASRESGVLRKIRDQAEAWTAAGHEVRLFLLSPRLQVWVGLEKIEVSLHHSVSLTERIRSFSRVVDEVLAWTPDVVYHRFGRFYPGLGRIQSQVPTIIEINTNDLEEARQQAGVATYVYHRITRRLPMSRASGFVFVAQHFSELPQYARFRKPGVVIGNSINLQAVPVLPRVQNDRPRILFIGTSGHPWHGVDKIMQFAQFVPEWDFDIIGYGRKDVSEVPRNVTLHGHLDMERYLPIAARADLAFGSLALHRIGVHEISPLKVREYLAFGLPCVIGYRDTDFPRAVPFILSLPNTEDNLLAHLPILRDFVNEWRGRRVPREAISHLDTRQKEAQRLRFFEHVMRLEIKG